MEDVNISKYRASVVREGSKPASPGFVVSEGQSPTDPAGSGQNHLPVTIAPVSTALAITENQILSGAGTVAQYIRGDGSLADFPESSGGGSSVSYYLNGSVNQGTIGGVAYKELNKVPILGAGTDFSINADGYIASFITDVGDPNLLEIPGGNWNFETYFSASSSGGTPTFYVELYKVSGTTATLIASSVTSPEFIAFGTNLTPYFSTLAVPTTTLALTDRLAVRYYVTHSGRTITLHTENNHLCQIITTFTTGLTALNGLTTQVQFFAVGTSGTDFNIASSVDTHTFNLPTASATNRGALSSADWSTFNNKQNAGNYVTIDTGQTISGAKTFTTATRFDAYIRLKHDIYLDHISGYSTIGSDANNFFLAASSSKYAVLNVGNLTGQQTYTFPNASGTIALVGAAGVGTVTSVAALTLGTSGTDLNSTVANGTTTPVITLNVPTASASNRGALSSADWTTFNNKQNALTNPVTGTGTTGQVAYFNGTSSITGESNLFWDAANDRLGIGTASPSARLQAENTINTTYSSSDTLNGGVVLYIKNASNTNSTDATIRLEATGSANLAATSISAVHTGNGSSDLTFGTRLSAGNVTERMRITSSGNLGLGVTPSAWGTFRALQIGTNYGALSFSGIGGTMITNAFFDGSTYRYLNNDFAAAFEYNISSGGGFVWRQAPSGTAGAALTFTQAMTLGSNSGLSIGTPSAAPAQGLLVQGEGRFNAPVAIGAGTQAINADAELTLRDGVAFVGLDFKSARTSGNVGGLRFYNTSSDSVAIAQQLIETDGKFVFYNGTSGAEARLTITSSGNVGIGITNPIYKFEISDGTRTGVFNPNSVLDGFFIGTYQSKPLIFGTADTERMRITSGGNVLIGTTTDVGAKLYVNGDIRTAAPSGGSAVNWKLGTARGGTITPNAIVRVEIGGVLVDLDARYV